MGTNNFLPFCNTDTGTNLPTQGDYAVDPNRAIGNSPGIASSKLNNKPIRQATAMASQIAQYIANKGNVNVLDDGDMAALLAQVVSTFAPQNSPAIENLTIAASVGASALTISVKTALGVNPSLTDQVFVSVRDSTLSSGLYNRRAITSSLSLVVSSGSTLGQVSGQPSVIYVYLIDNAGTLELAVSGTMFPEDILYTTTAEGGAGAADSKTVMYSASARSNVTGRLIGYILNTQATAGTWASAPTQIQLLPANTFKQPTVQRFTSGSGTYITPAGVKYLIATCVGGGSGGAGSSTIAGLNGGMGQAGTASFFNSSGYAQAGAAGTTGQFQAGAGGTNTISGPIVLDNVPGSAGATTVVNSTGLSTGAPGAPGYLGGGGGNGGNGVAGQNAAANTGAGGAGAGFNGSQYAGSGGGGGGMIRVLIQNPLASYAYQVGAGGTGGVAGTSGLAGGNGGSGVVIVEEYYN